MIKRPSSLITRLHEKGIAVATTNRKLCQFFFVLVSCSFIIYYYPTNIYVQADLKSCKLPRLDPFDKTLDPYRGIPKYVHCSNRSSLMYVDNNGYLQVNSSAVMHYSLTSVKCMYYKIHRLDGDKKIYFEDGVNFEPPIFISSRMFRVVCKTKNRGKVYDFIHVNMAWNESRSKEKEIGYENDTQLSVIFIGLDSISRSQAIRNFPKSLQYLTETLGAYDFQGYTKIGMNTYPNLMALLTGEHYYKFVISNILRLTYLDKVPFLWNEPEMKHYATFFSEDRLDLATFIEPLPGFNKPPTDYYYRPFLLATEQVEPVILERLGHSSMHCYGNRDHASLEIDYLKQFISKYTGRLKFAFFWKNGVNHDSHNYDFWDDKPLYDLLQWLKSNGHLEKSVLIVGSDHGSRTSGIGSTHIGRIENNLPFLTVYIPEIIKRKYPRLHENLNYNTKKLTSPFDLHKTLKDVITMQYSGSNQDSKLGQSLFTRVPEVRTCDDASVPAQYCTCYEEESVEISNPFVLKLAKFAVDHLNVMLKNYRDVCRELFLHNVTLAKVVYTAEGDSDRARINRNPWFFQRILGNWESDKSGRYILVLFTKPNYGLIEFMIEYEKNPSYGRKKKTTVVGDPSRLNRYGNQSHCIHEKTLKQYCLCLDIDVKS